MTATEDGETQQRPAPLAWDRPISLEGLSCLHQQVAVYQQVPVPSSRHVCATCSNPFTVTPAVPAEKLEQWADCLGWQCASYTPTRDPELIGGVMRDEETL